MITMEITKTLFYTKANSFCCNLKQDLSDEEYAEWAERYSEAAFLSGNREEAMTELFDFVESDLTLLGATGKLQPGF